MKSQLISIFNFSSWYGQKNCIKTIYIYTYKDFFIPKTKNKKKTYDTCQKWEHSIMQKKYMSVTLINFIDRS